MGCTRTRRCWPRRTGCFTGDQRLAALVEVVPNGELELKGQVVSGPELLAWRARDDVVPRLPHDGAVVRQDAKRVRCGASPHVDVIGVRRVARGAECSAERTGILRAHHTLTGADSRDVLRSEDQHPAPDVLGHPIGEALARHRPGTGLDPGEPHLDRVARLRAGDGGAVLGQPDVVGVPVALTALPLRHLLPGSPGP